MALYTVLLMAGLVGAVLVVVGVLLFVSFRSSSRKNRRKLRVCFVHPDLGIGGAEKLVVEAAEGIQKSGHEVVLYTAYHDPDPNRSFPATHNGTLEVRVHGNWLPYQAVGRFQLVKALLRFLWLSLVVLRHHKKRPFDVLFVDQISATVPLLKLSGVKVVFYCHFPDQLLTHRRNLLKRLYRYPFDWLEEVTTGLADEIIVNSQFTASVFKQTFTHIRKEPDVLYPAVELDTSSKASKNFQKGQPIKFLSLNRFERKKNIVLALEAFAELLKKRKQQNPSNNQPSNIQLIVAGGYSDKVQENIDHLQELKQKAAALKIEEDVTFLTSVSTKLRDQLIQECICLLYTPSNEHFGIVPLEAGLLSTAVIACNSGGPLETILHEQTGFLLPPDPSAWSEAMNSLINDPNLALRMGKQGKTRVATEFSRKKFISNLLHFLTK